MSYLTHLECAHCEATYDPAELHRLCPVCEKPLLARYDLNSLRRAWQRSSLAQRAPGLWRYKEALPVESQAHMFTLGEGGTLLLKATKLGEELGLEQLFVKDEGLNPTGSFKARGLCVAVCRAAELGVDGVVIPSAGNAAGAMCAYAARASLPAHVVMPRDVPAPFLLECKSFGAEITLVEGTIADCGRRAGQIAQASGWFDLSTLKEPYRVEGKKTMGYELAEDLAWELPDVIVYPTGGGTGLIGMWKAFDELEALGWIGAERPRMVAVQAEGCAPIVRAFHAGATFASLWEGAETVAAGLRVPAAVGDFLILEALRESQGTALSVAEEELLAGQRSLAQAEGILACPEGGATLAALRTLCRQGWVEPHEQVVLFNTGTGIKYPDTLEAATS